MSLERLQKLVSSIGGLQALGGQGDQQQLLRQQLASQQQQMGQQEAMHPLEQQIAQQKLQQLLYENSPEQRGFQNDMMTQQMQRGGLESQAVQAAGYMGDPGMELIKQLLTQRGYLQPQAAPVNPADEQLKQQMVAAMQQRGIAL